MFSQKEVEKFLGDVPNEFAHTVTMKETGPAYMDPWLKLKKRKNIFQHIEPAQGTLLKKKILFSASLLNDIHTLPFALTLMASILKYYDVYVWRGEKAEMRDVRPVNNAEEFWQAFKNGNPGDVKHVKESLGEQGFAADNFIIIDDEFYKNIITKFQNEIKEKDKFNREQFESLIATPNTLDLTGFNLKNLSSLLSTHSFTDIKNLTLIAPTQHEIYEILQAFPTLECVTIKDANLKWVKDLLPLFPHIDVKLEDLHTKHDSTLKLSKQLRLRSLHVDSPRIINIVAEKDCLLEGLYIGKSSSNIDIRHLKKLKELSFTNTFIDHFYYDKNNKIETLKINSWNPSVFEKLDLSKLKKLKKLSIRTDSCHKALEIGKSNAFLDFLFKKFKIDLRKAVPQIEDIDLESHHKCNLDSHIDLTRDTALKTARIYNPQNWKITFPKHIFDYKEEHCKETEGVHGDIEAWDIDGNRYNDLSCDPARVIYLKLYRNHTDLSPYTNLEVLNLSLNKYPDLKISSQKLKYIKIYDYQKRDNVKLDFSNCSDLQYCDLVISNSKNVDVDLKGCLNLTYFNLDIDHTPASLLNTGDCQNLHFVNLRTCNAEMLQRLFKMDLPPDVLFEIDQTKPLNYSNNSTVPSWSCPDCGIARCLGWCCVTSATPQSIQPSGSGRVGGSPLTKKKMVAITLLAMLITVGVELGIFAGLGSFKSEDSSSTPAPTPEPTPAPTSTPTNINSGSGFPAWGGYVIGASTLFLMLVITAGLLYRFRDRLPSLPSLPARRRRNNMNFFGGTAIDGVTYINQDDYVFAQGVHYNFFNGGKVDFDHVRLHIQNTIKYINGRIIFYTDLSDAKPINLATKKLSENKSAIQEYIKSIQASREHTLIYFNGVINNEKPYPLPTLDEILDANDLVEIYTDTPDTVKFIYSESTGQIYFSLNDESNRVVHKNVEFTCVIKQNPYYLGKDFLSTTVGEEIYVSDKELLPPDLKSKLDKELRKIDKLAYLFDDNLTLKEKAQRTLTLFRSFNRAELNPRPTDGLQILLEIIKQEKGVCRHCSEGYMTILRFLGIPVPSTTNKRHMFAALPYKNSEGKRPFRTQRVDLTLPDNYEEPSQTDMLVELLKEFVESLRKQNAAQEKILAANDPTYEAKKAAFNNYYEQFKKVLAVDELKSFDEVLEKPQVFAPLIELTKSQDTTIVNQQILKSVKANGMDALTQHIYIPSYEDLVELFFPNKIENNREVVDKKHGPLKQALVHSNKKAVIVWNLNNFSANEIASFQTLIDSEPSITVNGEYFIVNKENVLIVGLTHNSKKTGNAFLTRSKRWYIDESFFRDPYDKYVKDSKREENPPVMIPSGKTEVETKSEVLELDLFTLPAWREPILGKITYKKNLTILHESKLMKAIRLNQPIVIYNIPEDPELKLLITQINDERKFFFNGKMVSVPENVRVIVKQREHNEKLENLTIIEDHKQLTSKRCIEIGLHDLHELYNQLVIDSEDTSLNTKLGGLLKDYNSNTDVFYVVGGIPKAYWQALVVHIQKHYPNLAVNIALAPKAAIENVASNYKEELTENLTVEKLNTTSANVIASNDPDYVTVVIKSQEKATVNYVNKRSTFSDLIFNIKRDPENSDKFIYEPRGVLKALQDGKSVILSGEMSLALYLQLLPLLGDHPHLYVNGVRTDVKGKLRLVLPEDSLKLLPQIKASCSLTFLDYRHLLNLRPEEENNFRQIIRFYTWAQKFPHRGVARPSLPQLSYAHLRGLLNALNEKDPSHKHNPIKGFFNYDYQRHSEDQAYFNVLGKYYFAGNDGTAARIGKLRNLFARHEIRDIQQFRSHAWKILNCFNGGELQKLLGGNLEDVIDSRGFPTLNAKALETTYAYCQKLAATKQENNTKKVSHFDKQMLNLKTALKNPNISVITLKGEPGVGKTYTLRNLVGKVYEREAGLIEALTAKDNGEPIVFLWDEANTTLPGTLDFLIKGLCSKDRVVTFPDGREFVAPLNLKLVTMNNPEDFPSRYYHQAMQDYSETIYFEKPDDDFLEQIAANLLPEHLHHYKTALLHAYHLIEKYNPFFTTSIREMENIAKRFAFLNRGIKQDDGERQRKAFVDAALSEFGTAIKAKVSRSNFANDLGKHVGLKSNIDFETHGLIQLTDDTAITSEKRYLLNAVEEDLGMRLQALIENEKAKASQSNIVTLFGDKSEKKSVQQTVVPFKHATLVEGNPGIGKSRILRAIVKKYKNDLAHKIEILENEMDKLEKNSLSYRDKKIELNVYRTELNRQVYEISVGHKPSDVIKAFENNAIIIADESNLSPEYNAILNHYLSDEDLEGKEFKHFALYIGSQNSSALEGRLDASKNINDRSHMIYKDDYTNSEYGEYAKAANIEYPEEFVRAFEVISNQYNEANTRTFHNVLKLEAQQQHAKRDTVIDIPEREQLEVVVADERTALLKA